MSIPVLAYLMIPNNRPAMIMYIVILTDDGLLRNSKGTSGPSTPLASYVVSLKNTVISTVSKETMVGKSHYI